MCTHELSARRALLLAAMGIGIATSGAAAFADEANRGVPWSYGGAFAAWTIGRGQGSRDQIQEENAHALAPPATAKTGRQAPGTTVAPLAPGCMDVGRVTWSRSTPNTHKRWPCRRMPNQGNISLGHMAAPLALGHSAAVRIIWSRFRANIISSRQSAADIGTSHARWRWSESKSKPAPAAEPKTPHFESMVHRLQHLFFGD